MAFPYILQTTWDVGTNAEWTAETDTEGMLDFPHASELARFPWPEAVPYRGSNCARWRLPATATDAYLNSTTIDVADGGTSFFRWYLQLCPDFRATADNILSIFKLRQAGAGTVELTIGLSCVAATGVITIGGGDGVLADTFGTTPLELGKWHCIEVSAKVSTGSVGTLTIWLDNVQEVALTSLDQAAAVGDGELGFTDRLDTTTGTVLMDEFIQDDARIYPIYDRYPENMLLTKSRTVFLGTGCVDNISLLSGGGTDNVCTVFDTAFADVTDAHKILVELKNTAASELVDPAGTPFGVARGCYVQLAGTNPRALIKLKHASGYGSSANVRRAVRLIQPKIGEGA